MQDSLLLITAKSPLPDILPSEQTIINLPTQQIADIICQYTLETIDELHARLRPGVESSVGFLGPYQWLAPVIIHDAKYLFERQILRGQVADALDLIIAHHAVEANFGLQESDPSRYRKIVDTFEDLKSRTGIDPAPIFTVYGIPGRSVSDPFHPTYDNPTIDACMVYWVIRKEDEPKDQDRLTNLEKQWPQEKCIRFTKLHPVMIRRLCFFEGPGTKYRLDPEKCCRVLGIKVSEK